MPHPKNRDLAKPTKQMLDRFGKAVLPEIDYQILPNYLRGGLRRYIEQGIKPGGFLTAVLENDLKEAVGRNSGTTETLDQICSFLYNEAPGNCHGSKAIVEKWITDHAKARMLARMGIA